MIDNFGPILIKPSGSYLIISKNVSKLGPPKIKILDTNSAHSRVIQSDTFINQIVDIQKFNLQRFGESIICDVICLVFGEERHRETEMWV